jgi:hypothetical protein
MEQSRSLLEKAHCGTITANISVLAELSVSKEY